MSNLEKIQKGMRVFQILSKIVLVFAIVGVALTSIAAVLVAADISLLFGGVTSGICLLLLAMVMRYGAELEQKTKGGKI